MCVHCFFSLLKFYLYNCFLADINHFQNIPPFVYLRVSFNDLAQAITALKKGAYLLKYGRRGKPKFCPFRLSNVSLVPFVSLSSMQDFFGNFPFFF